MLKMASGEMRKRAGEVEAWGGRMGWCRRAETIAGAVMDFFRMLRTGRDTAGSGGRGGKSGWNLRGRCLQGRGEMRWGNGGGWREGRGERWRGDAGAIAPGRYWLCGGEADSRAGSG